MPKLNEMLPSKFLKKEDIDDEVIVTIKGVSEENVGRDDQPEMKWCVHFREFDRPLVMNKTIMTVLAQIANSDDTDDWAGKKGILYVDPNVSFGGKIVGGLRMRPAKIRPKPAPAAALDEDDIPFE